MKFYPIVIFCYNRPNHLKKLLNSIYKNKDFNKYKYYFYCFKKNKFSIQPMYSMIKNTSNYFSGYYKSFRFSINESFSETFNPFKYKNNEYNKKILKKIYSIKEIDNFIQHKHEPSIKLYLKLLFKKFI